MDSCRVPCHGHAGSVPQLNLGLTMYIILGVATLLKLVRHAICGKKTPCAVIANGNFAKTCSSFRWQSLCVQALYFYCVALRRRSDSMAAMAEDHLNDVMSNAGAIVTAGIAGAWSKGWW